MTPGANSPCPLCASEFCRDAFPGDEASCGSCGVLLVFMPEGWRPREPITECLFCGALVGAVCPLALRGQIPAHGRRPCARVSSVADA